MVSFLIISIEVPLVSTLYFVLMLYAMVSFILVKELATWPNQIVYYLILFASVIFMFYNVSKCSELIVKAKTEDKPLETMV